LNGAYSVLAVRIRQELSNLKRVADRAARALRHAAMSAEQQDLFLDAAALNLHDFYCGLERIFLRIAETADDSVPQGHEWHRELLRQMTADLPSIRPRVLSDETTQVLDEYLRFRHVVRNLYALEFDFDRVERLVQELGPCLGRVELELTAFAAFLNELARDGRSDSPVADE
jgi:hypothetical protein